ncbi:MAG: heat shock protein HspQ [Alphaproteobacteria bacterium]|nr:heat shock protein HspQ [Alphaproteobacteria bacterium]
MIYRQAKFSVGQIVRHRLYPFRGVIYDVDPTFNNSEEWYQSIPADRRPSKDQPFYHLLAQNAQGGPYEAYVSEQNLLPDGDNGPISHPMIDIMFEKIAGDRYLLRPQRRQ